MIKSLSLTAFKGVTATHAFAAGNLVTGRNFSGKTAIVDAITGLILGYIPRPGIAKTTQAVGEFASDFPMSIGVDGDGPVDDLILSFDKVKGTPKRTAERTLQSLADARGEPLDETIRVLFDPSLFFGLSDAARISKMCHLVQTQSGGTPRADLDAAVKAAIANNALLVSYLPEWAESISGTTTINDDLTASEAYWKGVKKSVTEEKSRLSKTGEGLSDMSAVEAQAAQLPTREAATARKTAAFEAIQDLTRRIQAIMSRINAEAARKGRRATLTSTAATIHLAEAKAHGTRQDVEVNAVAVERLRERVAMLGQERDKIEAAVSAATKMKDRVAWATAKASILAELEADKARCDARIVELESSLAPLSEALSLANATLRAVRQEASAPKQAPTAAVRTDDFYSNAKEGPLYQITCKGVKYDGCKFDMIEVVSWSEIIERTEDDDEADRMRDYELSQRTAEAEEAYELACKNLATAKENLANTRALLKEVDERLPVSRAAAAELKSMSEVAITVDQSALVAARNSAAEAQRALTDAIAREKAARIKCDEAKDALFQVRAAVEELARMDADGGSAEPVPTDLDVALKESLLLAAKTDHANAEALIHRIVAFEQDKKRIQEAAAKRETVEAALKIVGKVIDLIAEKKSEIVSLSIDAPLAIANKLAAGILKGPLVFETGELGMRVGDRFVSSKTFSGTETAIVMAGLTAGLAHRSSLRVVMLDEIGRLDTGNAVRLASNLEDLLAHGDIDQFILVGPENPALVAELYGAPINIINV